MKKILKLIMLLMFIGNNGNAQISAIIDQVLVNSQTTVNLCNTIDFGYTQSNNLLFYFTLGRANNQAVGDGTVKIYLKNSPSSNPIEKGSMTILSSFWAPTQYSGSISCTIGANEIQVSGSFIYIEFNNGSVYRSCGNPIIKAPPPTFTINPASVNIPCNDISAKTFTVNSTNTNGASLSYNWSYPGWNFSSSGLNSITLTPMSGTILPTNVSVIPVFNGVSQPPLSCIVSRSSFSSSSIISGTTGICTGSSNYTITGVTSGQSVSWTLSNPSIGSLFNQSNTGVTVTFNGNGAQTLSATITNACGQTTVKTFVINTGSTTFVSTAVVSGSLTNACSGSRVFTVTNLPAGQNVSWSVSNSSVATLSGTSNAQATINFIGSGSVILQATITNSCGQSSLRTFALYSGFPTLTSFTCDIQSKPFCAGGQINAFTSTMPDLNLNDRVTATFSGMTTTEINLAANWEWRPINNKLSLSGSKNNRLVGSLNFGITGLEVRARNACGWSPWYPLNWELVEVPDPLKQSIISSTKIVVFPNPSSNTWVFKTNNEQFKTIELFDVYGKSIYTESFDSDEVSLNGSKFSKGIYFARVITTNSSETIKLIKN